MPSIEPSRRHFLFINDGQLQSPPTVRHLLRPLDPVMTGVSCGNVLNRFLADTGLYALPVVDEHAQPVTLVDRKQFIEFFSKLYSREIFGARPIMELLASHFYDGRESIMVEDGCSVEDAAKIMIDADVEQMVTGFLICSQGKYLGVANGHDLLNVITQRKQAELYHLAHYDSLTGVPNRMLFNDRFEHACLDAGRKNRLVALLFVEVDHFKRINDSLGHSAGDAVLCKVVERLKASARRTDTVARLAGDEFVILMEDLVTVADVDPVARRLVELMKEPITLHGHSLAVTVSVGSAIYPVDDTDVGTLLNKADAAMYHAKATGRNSYCAYSPATVMYNPASLLMVNDLRQAIEGKDLKLHYQPQVDLATGEVRGVEALVRWHHPTRGMIQPAQFIPMAEESGLIVALGESVLHQALRQMHAWDGIGTPPLRMSVNISAHQVYRRGFPRFLKALLNDYGVNPQQVELELTESVLMQNSGDVLHTLNAIKALGVQLAIDDFGTGFSSLSYLSRFPIDRLKIDQSFVRDIDRTPVNKSIAYAIVTLAQSLSLNLTAEGIEKTAEKHVIQEMGCGEGQGYLFSPALAADHLPAWLTVHRIRTRVKLAGHV